MSRRTIYTTADRAEAYKAAAPDADVLSVDLAALMGIVPAWARFCDGRLVDMGMTDHLATWGSKPYPAEWLTAPATVA